ncbi:hypothetical protein MICRO8M_20122 [Microbacterium sp. 8M]|nr:hypothetical protein MICRO8M_20122 [Microbacterium sp. 8M]
MDLAAPGRLGATFFLFSALPADRGDGSRRSGATWSDVFPLADGRATRNQAYGAPGAPPPARTAPRPVSLGR